MGAYVPEKLNALLAACAVARGTTARGAALEDLVEYVFSCVPSVSLHARDVLDESGAQEIDLVFIHFYPISMLPILDLLIFVECKNEKRKTSASEVREFASKLRSRGIHIGILVTGAGLSGTRGRAGHSAVRDELSHDVAIIVVTAQELVSQESPTGLVALLVRRLANLRTYRGYRDI